MITQKHLRELAVYTALTFGGLFIDLTLSNLLVYLLSFPLLIAGACGLLAGATVNYFVHITITFKDRFLSPSWKNYFHYLQTCLLGAACRLIILAGLSFFSAIPTYLALFLATGISFLVNYILSRFYVFKGH